MFKVLGPSTTPGTTTNTSMRPAIWGLRLGWALASGAKHIWLHAKEGCETPLSSFRCFVGFRLGLCTHRLDPQTRHKRVAKKFMEANKIFQKSLIKGTIDLFYAMLGRSVVSSDSEMCIIRCARNVPEIIQGSRVGKVTHIRCKEDVPKDWPQALHRWVVCRGVVCHKAPIPLA